MFVFLLSRWPILKLIVAYVTCSEAHLYSYFFPPLFLLSIAICKHALNFSADLLFSCRSPHFHHFFHQLPPAPKTYSSRRDARYSAFQFMLSLFCRTCRHSQYTFLCFATHCFDLSSLHSFLSLESCPSIPTSVICFALFIVALTFSLLSCDTFWILSFLSSLPFFLSFFRLLLHQLTDIVDYPLCDLCFDIFFSFLSSSFSFAFFRINSPTFSIILSVICDTLLTSSSAGAFKTMTVEPTMHRPHPILPRRKSRSSRMKEASTALEQGRKKKKKKKKNS